MAVAAAARTAAEIRTAAAAERYYDDQVQAYGARSEHQEQSGQEHLHPGSLDAAGQWLSRAAKYTPLLDADNH